MSCFFSKKLYKIFVFKIIILQNFNSILFYFLARFLFSTKNASKERILFRVGHKKFRRPHIRRDHVSAQILLVDFLRISSEASPST